MADERIEEGGSRNTPPAETQADGLGKAEPDAELADALARVQEVVTDMKDGELRESLEAAIDAIDSARETPDAADDDQLVAVADALEGALDELEKGKVANLVPVIEQAQSIIRSGSAEPEKPEEPAPTI